MFGGKGWFWFDFIAAVTVSLGVVCLEFLRWYPRHFCQSSGKPTWREQHVVIQRMDDLRYSTMHPSKQEEIFISKQTLLTLPTRIWSFLSKTFLASLKWEELPIHNSEFPFVASLFTPLGLPQLVI